MSGKPYTDHKNNKYVSESAMCAEYNMPYSTYKGRIARGWTVEQALTIRSGTTERKVNLRDGHVKDHEGNEFPSIAEMCRFWKISEKVYWSRKRLLKWPLGKILTTPVKAHEDTANAIKIKDHLGQEFPSISAMCRHWKIGLSTYRERRKRSWSVEQALTEKKIAIKTEKSPCYDHRHVRYPSKNAMCAAYHITRYCFESRLKLGWSLERALTEPHMVNAKPCEDHTGKQFPASIYMAQYLGFPKHAFHRTNIELPSLIPGFASQYWPGRKFGTFEIKTCIAFPWFLVENNAGKLLLSFDQILDAYHKSHDFTPLPETKVKNPAVSVIKAINWPWYLCSVNDESVILDYDSLIHAHADANFGLSKN